MIPIRGEWDFGRRNTISWLRHRRSWSFQRGVYRDGNAGGGALPVVDGRGTGQVGSIVQEERLCVPRSRHASDRAGARRNAVCLNRHRPDIVLRLTRTGSEEQAPSMQAPVKESRAW